MNGERTGMVCGDTRDGAVGFVGPSSGYGQKTGRLVDDDQVFANMNVAQRAARRVVGAHTARSGRVRRKVVPVGPVAAS